MWLGDMGGVVGSYEIYDWNHGQICDKNLFLILISQFKKISFEKLNVFSLLVQGLSEIPDHLA